jgi:PAS domain S-box-containing protein
MMGRWPFFVFATLLVVSLGLIGLLGRSVVTDVRVLSSAQNDDVSWRMSQLEVELLRLQNVTQTALSSPESSISEVRKRFDIFYSRITTLRQSALYQSFNGDPAIAGHLNAAIRFLDKTTPLIDSEDRELRAALPAMHADIIQLAPDVRGLALLGIGQFTAQEEIRRETFTHTLTSLVVGIIALITVLFVALAILIMLYRQGQKISQTSDIARRRFEAAISSSLDAVLVVDSNGHIIEFNGAAQTVFGFSRDQVLGKDMVELIVPPHLRDAHRDGMQRFLRTGDKRVIDAGRVRLEGLRKSGEIFPVELSISMSKAHGEMVFVSYVRDITKELEAEQELKEALEKAQLGEKTKSNLLTVMSHEMRTPLNGILGSLELIDQSAMSDGQKKHLNAIALSGDLLLSHVNDVLDLSKLSAESKFTERSVFNLSDLVKECVESLSANASARGNTLTIHFEPGDIAFVKGYRRSLQRCIMNLVGNAIKFTRDGVINVDVERLSSDEMEIRVADTGVGIAPENLGSIFEEFVTIDTAFDRTNNGTGLGLAITKRLVAQMGGEIEADSILDEGSLFVMRLPLVAAQPNELSQPILTAGEMSQLQRGFEALVVDDNEINRDILGALLSEFGGNVVTASNGYDAIALCQKHTFDVLMLDISMPEIDGIETLRRIRDGGAQLPALPAIAVTAHASPDDHRKILASGFASLLVKPVSRSAAHQCLAGVFDLPLAHAEPPALEQDSASNEFLDQFGAERFAQVMVELERDLGELLERLDCDSPLTQTQKEEVHKLSGSAAVLGQTDIWEHLQSVQNASDALWLSEGVRMTAELREDIASLRAAIKLVEGA